MIKAIVRSIVFLLSVGPLIVLGVVVMKLDLFQYFFDVAMAKSETISSTVFLTLLNYFAHYVVPFVPAGAVAFFWMYRWFGPKSISPIQNGLHPPKPPEKLVVFVGSRAMT